MYKRHAGLTGGERLCLVRSMHADLDLVQNKINDGFGPPTGSNLIPLVRKNNEPKNSP